MDRDSVRMGTHGSHRDKPPHGWLRIAGMIVVGAVATTTATLTGSAETAVAVIAPLLPLIPR